MRKYDNIINRVILYPAFILVFLVLSCNEKDQGDRNDSGKGSANVESLKGETYNERLAEHSYKKYCVVCHGVEGKGDGVNAVNLDPRPPDFTDVEYMSLLTHEYLVQAISQGGQKINKSPLMPVWGNTLTSDDIQRLATYVSNIRLTTDNTY